MPGFRFRVGDYPIIFDIHQEKLQILVYQLGHRKNIYDHFKRYDILKYARIHPNSKKKSVGVRTFVPEESGVDKGRLPLFSNLRRH